LILEVIEGRDAGKRVVVDKPIVVGRDPEAGFVLEDSEVSRLHLRLSPSASYVTVEDLGSANGTFVCLSSAAHNLVQNDTNRESDGFLRGPLGSAGPSRSRLRG